MTTNYKGDILIVDDMLPNLRLLSEILSANGYKARGIPKSAMALATARSALPDLILLDVMMPGMNGYEVCEQIKADELTRDIPVIFLSALDEVTDKVKGFAVGGVDFITKPFQEKEVLARIQTHLSIRNLQKSLKAEITERRHAEEKLRIAKDAAEAANRAKSEFLANMSHEIRTPMNSVLGFLKLTLESPDLSEFQKKNLNIAYNSAKSLLTLLNDILDLSKLESGKLELEEVPFDLPELIQDTFTIFELKCREKGLSLSLNIRPDMPRYVIGDPIRLRQILINLVGNALKFTEKGGITVTIRPSDQEKMVYFSVTDTGIGIPADKLNSIFDPFTQADSSTVRRFGGTGLGTTISKQLVELMGGIIWAESEKGKGSTFHFTVKLETSETEQPICQETIIETPRVKRRFKILLAEDIEENILLAKIRLEQQGHTVIEARNGLEAVAAFQKERPDIILMDVHMPEMDGIEATRLIRNYELNDKNPTQQNIPDSEFLVPKFSRVPIVALTASVTSKEHQKYLHAEMDDVVAKPIDFDKLFAVMEKVVPLSEGQKGEEIELAEKCREKSIEGSELEETRSIREVIDWKKGLKTWQNEAAYRKALLSFCMDYETAADKLRGFLESGDREGAYSAVHALKGVAGNLSITEVFSIASVLNVEIRNKPAAELMQMVESLAAALNTAIHSIRTTASLNREQMNDGGGQKLEELTDLKELFRKILSSFDEYNPEATEPFLEKLAQMLSFQKTEPIRRQLDLFSFDNAKMETLKLAGEIGIETGMLTNIHR